VALACVPALAYLALLNLNQLLPALGKPFGALPPQVQHWVATITVLSGGFIVTSLLWATSLAHLIDGRMREASATLALAGVFAWFGVIHSPLPEGPIVAPSAAIARLKAEGRFEAAAHQTPYHWAAAYGGMAVTLLLLARWGRPPVAEGAGHPEPS
jgi:AGZA family xanthine/uracil permease-like MFS transporter